MKAKELRDLLKEMGLPTTGSKAQLMERLEKSAQPPEDEGGGGGGISDKLFNLTPAPTTTRFVGKMHAMLPCCL